MFSNLKMKICKHLQIKWHGKKLIGFNDMIHQSCNGNFNHIKIIN